LARDILFHVGLQGLSLILVSSGHHLKRFLD
jgi:hypothetical protein